jgi:monoamine oxidase
LHAFYPQARGAYTGYEIRRYSVDPSTGGAYLAFGPGQISKYWRLWEKPVQRVAFAGEHTDTLFPGTLEGALRTGQRAATQVQDMAAGKSFEPVKVAPATVPAAPKASGGNFFSNMFGGSSDKTEAKKPEPAADIAKPQEKKGFFSRLFGGADEPVAQPVEKAPEPAPAPAPVPVAPVAAPVVAPAKSEPAKTEPAKKAPVKKEPVKKAPAKPAAHKTPAQIEAAKKAAAKAAAAKAAKTEAVPTPAVDPKN